MRSSVNGRVAEQVGLFPIHAMGRAGVVAVSHHKRRSARRPSAEGQWSLFADPSEFFEADVEDRPVPDRGSGGEGDAVEREPARDGARKSEADRQDPQEAAEIDAADPPRAPEAGCVAADPGRRRSDAVAAGEPGGVVHACVAAPGFDTKVSMAAVPEVGGHVVGGGVGEYPPGAVPPHREASSARRRRRWSKPRMVFGSNSEVCQNQEVGPMDDRTKLSSRVNVCHKSHQDPLRKLTYLLAEPNPGGLDAVAKMPVGELAAWLSRVPTSRTGSRVKKPGAMARKILKALAHVRAKFPDDGFPEVPEASGRRTFRQVPLREQPEAYREDMTAYDAMNTEARGRETSGRRALMKSTAREYRKKRDQCLGVAMDLGLVRDGTFGVRLLVAKEVVAPVLAEMARHHKPRTMVGTVAALLRVATDMLGDDPDHKADLALLRSELKKLLPECALTAEEIMSIIDLGADEPFASDLADAPDAMAERADAPGLKPRDAAARIAAALAVEIKLTHPSTTPGYLVRIDLDTDIEDVDGQPHLWVPDPASKGGLRQEPLTPRAIRILERLRGVRAEAGIVSSKLFPACRENGNAGPDAVQLERVAMEFVTGELSAVLGRRLTMSKLKAVCLHRSMIRTQLDLAVLAEVYGYASEASLRCKMAPLIDKRAA